MKAGHIGVKLLGIEFVEEVPADRVNRVDDRLRVRLAPRGDVKVEFVWRVEFRGNQREQLATLPKSKIGLRDARRAGEVLGLAEIAAGVGIKPGARVHPFPNLLENGRIFKRSNATKDDFSIQVRR